MKFDPVHIEFYENVSGGTETPYPYMKVNAGGKIITSTIEGPLYLNRHTQIGPDARVGKYVGMNADGYIARTTVGAYCAFGARNAINPFSHPVDWLSINEFQYHPMSFDWVSEYTELQRLERTPDMFKPCTVGNDVWTGHNVNIMGGITVGHGAIIAAGAVVTKDVPAYAIVGGIPAQTIRFRFPDAIIERLLRVRWWDMELADLSGLNFRDIEDCLPRLEDMRARQDAADHEA